MSTSVLDDVALFFTDCMKNPARPARCARVLCGCIHLLDGRDDDDPWVFEELYSKPRNDEYSDICERYHEYLNAYAAFLSLPRSNKERKDLDSSMRMCTCLDPPNSRTWLLKWLHKFEPTRILCHAVDTKTVGGVTALSGLKKNRRKGGGCTLWPVDSSQLLPYGTEQFMKGYAISFRPFRDDRFHEILLLVTKFIGICGRTIIPPSLRGRSWLASGDCSSRDPSHQQVCRDAWAGHRSQYPAELAANHHAYHGFLWRNHGSRTH
ncbi:hypothetical protein DAEQUDRAFT_388958 [Daedalea quercina L-15889]|uniref:Uncharacterized protein n=1 Tax=Daedalea quercina L-15889 TaxID=1314783 RepID=A0A165NZ80_9APHY|nr:hypothetical protein DAEQUDRAFT_388958 [Daedalea quercina L-15889]